MNCIIVDDEPLAIDVIADYVSKVSFLNLKKKCKNAIEAYEIIQTEPIDLIFLDVKMPKITGVQFAKSLETKPMIIFTTAYTNYAVEGFDLSAVDYLVKPIPYERFLKAVNKAYSQFNQRKNSSEQTVIVPNQDTTNDYIFVKSDYKNIKVKFDNILYLEGLKDYIKIYTKDSTILTLNSLKKMSLKLPSKNFIRIHRSYIVSIDKIVSIQRSRIIIGKQWIPIGEHYKNDFFKKLEIDD